jgi:hypothetical protein
MGLQNFCTLVFKTFVEKSAEVLYPRAFSFLIGIFLGKREGGK